MSNEPVITTALVTSAITAVIALLVAFGLHVSADQTAAIITVAVIAMKVGSVLYVRSKVTPVKKR